MEKAKIRPLATRKPFNRYSQKLAGVIRSWMARGMQNSVTIGLGVSALKYVILPSLKGKLVFFVFWGYFNKVTAYTFKRRCTQHTSNDIVTVREVPFGGPDDYILHLHSSISEKPPF